MRRILLIVGLAVVSFAAVEWEFDSLAALEFSRQFEDSTEVFEALSDAGGNWEELRDAILGVEEEYRDDAIWLLSGMTHLDRLLMKSGILVEHIEYAHKIKDEARYPLADSMFRDYILAYRISYEPVTAWRKDLYDFFTPMIQSSSDPKAVAGVVNTWIADSIEKADYNFFGGMQSPDMTMRRPQRGPL